MASPMLLGAGDRNITQTLLDKYVSLSSNSNRSIILTTKYQFLMGFCQTKIMLLSPIPMVAAM